MIVDTSNWPIVTYEMPEQVPDSEAKAHIDAMQAVLDRKEPFVLIFHGTEYPRDSKHFMKTYRKWGLATRDLQKTYCKGAVRIEPDETKRKSLLKQALAYLTSRFMVYPYKVVATMAEAQKEADNWLKATP